jgi:hypothetical protein
MSVDPTSILQFHMIDNNLSMITEAFSYAIQENLYASKIHGIEMLFPLNQIMKISNRVFVSCQMYIQTYLPNELLLHPFEYLHLVVANFGKLFMKTKIQSALGIKYS